MNWSEEKAPNEEIRYNHVLCKTPLGTCSIEWKGWKDRPSYDIWISGANIHVGTEYRLDHAKKLAKEYLIEINNSLTAFLKNEG